MIRQSAMLVVATARQKSQCLCIMLEDNRIVNNESYSVDTMHSTKQMIISFLESKIQFDHILFFIDYC